MAKSNFSTGIKPYMFEPDGLNPEDGESPRDEELSPQVRSGVNISDWCNCGCCSDMSNETELRCCQEDEKFIYRCREDGANYKCITGHPGFKEVALSIHNLRALYFQYRQQYGAINEDDYSRYRYVAYRHTTRWVYGILGKHIRITLPSCVVTAIRNEFPSAQYVGFKFPSLD